MWLISLYYSRQMHQPRIVILGGGFGGLFTALDLAGSGEVTLVSDEDHLPYDRPPLSKEVLRAEVDDVTLKPAEFYEDNDITVRLGNGVRSVDAAAQAVTLADGDEVAYDELIIATGLVPRTIPSFPDLEGIRVLRSLEESIALREHAGSAGQADPCRIDAVTFSSNRPADRGTTVRGSQGGI